MTYRVLNKDGIRSLASGKHWRSGAVIGDAELNPRIINSLLDEGAIEAVVRVVEKHNDPLLDVPYVTEVIAGALHAIDLNTVEQVAGAPVAVVMQAQGVGQVTAQRIIAAAQRLSAPDEPPDESEA